MAPFLGGEILQKRHNSTFHGVALPSKKKKTSLLPANFSTGWLLCELEPLATQSLKPVSIPTNLLLTRIHHNSAQKGGEEEGGPSRREKLAGEWRLLPLEIGTSYTSVYSISGVAGQLPLTPIAACCSWLKKPSKIGRT